MRRLARPCQWDLAMRPCRKQENAEPAMKFVLDLAKVLRLPRNLYPTLPKCCACHEILTLRNLRVAVTVGPAPRSFRTCRRTGVATVVAFSQLEKPKPAEGCSFSRFLFPRHTRTHVFSHASILPISHLCASYLQLVSATRKCLRNFLRLLS